jgi:cytochrome c oxidase cbb3-type subunit 4
MSTFDYINLSTAMTAIMLVVFIGIVAWAYSGKRRARFEEAARLPFDDGAAPDQHAYSKFGE